MPLQLVPGVPIQGQGHAFSRLVGLVGGTIQPTRILIEEYSGTPGVPGQYAWTRDMSAGEAEEVLWGWLRGGDPLPGELDEDGALRPHLATGDGEWEQGTCSHSAPAPPGLALAHDRGQGSRQCA